MKVPSGIHFSRPIPQCSAQAFKLYLCIAISFVWTTVAERKCVNFHGCCIFTAATVHTTAAPFANHENNTVLPHKEECESYHRLEELLGPYAFPMLIEYCVLSATMILVIWENSGIGYEPKGTTANSSSDSDEATAPVDEGIVMRSRPSLASLYKRHSVATLGSTADLSSLFSQSYHVKPTQHYNSFSGFVFGWIIICATSGTVILSLYRLYTDFEDNKTDGGFEDPNVHNVTYGSNAILSILCIIAAPITFFKLSKLTFEDEEALETVLNEKGKDDVEYASDVKERIDNQLGVITLLCLISWKIFCIIAAFDQDDAVLLADGVISIIFGMIQSLFLTYAQKKRTKTRSQLLRKPGYQGLEFLRLTNFALWLNNTFLLKHPYAKSMMNATYGEMEWAVLSNIFQPLSILYYFHAMISVTETVHHVYSSKFVGIVRQSKQRMATMTQINEEQEDFDWNSIKACPMYVVKIVIFSHVCTFVCTTAAAWYGYCTK